MSNPWLQFDTQQSIARVGSFLDRLRDYQAAEDLAPVAQASEPRPPPPEPSEPPWPPVPEPLADRPILFFVTWPNGRQEYLDIDQWRALETAAKTIDTR